METTPLFESPLPTRDVAIREPDVRLGHRGSLLVIAGPCSLEDETLARTVASTVRDICAELGLPYVFKASYDKANRTSLESWRGPGLEAGLEILKGIRDEVGVPVLSDVHTPAECGPAGEVLDVLQVPAFLCRQTDLLLEAGRTGKPVNIKKGQFVAPHDLHHAVKKVEHTGNERVFLTERGASFGYNSLVVDMRAIPIMQRTSGVPVVFDAGHSVQAPGGLGASTGGDRSFIPTLTRAAVAAGADGLFVETHPEPARAKSDGPNQMPLNELETLLRHAADLARLLRSS